MTDRRRTKNDMPEHKILIFLNDWYADFGNVLVMVSIFSESDTYRKSKEKGSLYQKKLCVFLTCKIIIVRLIIPLQVLL